MLVGGILVASWGGFRNRIHTMIASNLAMALCTIGLGLAPWIWLYLAVMGVFGVAPPLFNSPSALMIQEHGEQEYMGRVFSVLTMLSTSIMPIGMLIFGPLADIVRIEWLLVPTGTAMLAHGIAVLGNRRLIETGVPVKPAADRRPGLESKLSDLKSGRSSPCILPATDPLPAARTCHFLQVVEGRPIVDRESSQRARYGRGGRDHRCDPEE